MAIVVLHAPCTDRVEQVHVRGSVLSTELSTQRANTVGDFGRVGWTPCVTMWRKHREYNLLDTSGQGSQCRPSIIGYGNTVLSSTQIVMDSTSGICEETDNFHQDPAPGWVHDCFQAPTSRDTKRPAVCIQSCLMPRKGGHR
jgi:hypothetical protein